MDPITAIGTAASIVQLVQTAGSIIRTTHRLYKSIKDAPQELSDVVKQVEFGVSLVQANVWTEAQSDDLESPTLPSFFAKALALRLSAVQDALDSLESVCCHRNNGKLGMEARFRWAFLDKAVATRFLERLREETTQLTQVTIAIQSQLAIDSKIMVSRLLQRQNINQEIVLQRIDAIVEHTVHAPSKCKNVVDDEYEAGGLEDEQNIISSIRTTTSNQITCYGRRATRAADISDLICLKRWSDKCGISASFNCIGDDFKSTRALSLQIDLPLVFGRRALILQFTFSHNTTSWTNMTILRGHAGVGRLISCTSDIWTACTTGDEARVRDLLALRLATPYDRLGSCSRTLTSRMIPLGGHSLFGNGDVLPSASICRGRGETLLDAAVWSGNLNLVKYLIRSGADVNSATFYQRSPIHIAFQKGNIEIIDYLVAKGASLDYVDSAGHTVLHKLTRSCRYERDISLDIWTKTTGLPLLKYLKSKHFEDFDTSDSDGVTPLYESALFGASDFCVKLLEIGGQIRTGDLAVVHCDKTWMHAAVIGGSLAVLDRFLRTDSIAMELNQRDNNGKTPLHRAFWTRPVLNAVVEKLLKAGANPMLKDNLGRTALFDAIWASSSITRRADVALIGLLLKYGAEHTVKDTAGNTSLHEAARYCNARAALILMESGIEVNVTNLRGESPLHIAAAQWTGSRFYKGHSYLGSISSIEPYNTLEALLSYGANPFLSVRYKIELEKHAIDAQLTAWDLAKMSMTSVVSEVFACAILKWYPGATHDAADQDIYWSAESSQISKGCYGSSWYIVDRIASTEDCHGLIRNFWEHLASHSVTTE